MDRYVLGHQDLPSHLQPSSIGTNVGLKTRVVRSLFFSRHFKSRAGAEQQRVPLVNAPSCGDEIPRDCMVESHWWKKLVSAKSCSVCVWRLYVKLVRLKKNNGSRFVYQQFNEAPTWSHIQGGHWSLKSLNFIWSWIVLEKVCFSTLGSSMFLNFSILWIFLYCMFYVSGTCMVYWTSFIFNFRDLNFLFLSLKTNILFLKCSWIVLEFFLNLSGHPDILLL